MKLSDAEQAALREFGLLVAQMVLAKCEWEEGFREEESYWSVDIKAIVEAALKQLEAK